MTPTKLPTAPTDAKRKGTPDLVALLDSIGGLVHEQELHRQFDKRGWDREEAMLALYEQMAEGKVECYLSVAKGGRS